MSKDLAGYREANPQEVIDWLSGYSRPDGAIETDHGLLLPDND